MISKQKAIKEYVKKYSREVYTDGYEILIETDLVETWNDNEKVKAFERYVDGGIAWFSESEIERLQFVGIFSDLLRRDIKELLRKR